MLSCSTAPCTSSLCLASVKNTVKRQGASQSQHARSCGFPQRTALTKIATKNCTYQYSSYSSGWTFMFKHSHGQSPTAPQRNEIDTLHRCSRNTVLRNTVLSSLFLPFKTLNIKVYLKLGLLSSASLEILCQEPKPHKIEQPPYLEE